MPYYPPSGGVSLGATAGSAHTGLTGATGVAATAAETDHQHPAQLSLAVAAASDYLARIKLTADTQYRLQASLDASSAPTLSFGPGGASALDTLVTRSGVAQLTLNGTLVRSGTQTVTATTATTTNNLSLNASSDRVLFDLAPDPTTITPAVAVTPTTSTTDGTVFSTATSISLVVNRAYLIVVASTAAATAPIPSLTAGGGWDITTTSVSSHTGAFGGAVARLSVFRARASSTTSGTITATFSGTQTGCFITAIELANATTTGTSLVSPRTVDGVVSNGEFATLSGSVSGTFGVNRKRRTLAVILQSAASNPTTPASHTSVTAGNYATPSAGLNVYYKTTPDETISYSSSADALVTSLSINPTAVVVTYTLRGMTGGTQGRVVRLVNRSSGSTNDPALYEPLSDAVVIEANSSTSTFGNRFDLPGNVIIPATGWMDFIYEDNYWRPMVKNTAPIRNVYTGSTTWTKPAGLSAIDVEVVGGGGAGGGAPTNAASNSSFGGGGGGGGYARKVFSAASLIADASLTVTVGGGGSGVSGATGNTGSTSSVSGTGITTIQATGGAGGTASPSGTTTLTRAGGAGGTGSGGEVNASGGVGEIGLRMSATAGICGGAGGDSRLGGGGTAQTGTAGANNGDAGSIYGGGGGGASSINGSAAATGGSGANGVVIITEYYA